MLSIVLALGASSTAPMLAQAAPPSPAADADVPTTIDAGIEAFQAGEYAIAYDLWTRVHPRVLAHEPGTSLEVLSVDIASACEWMVFQGDRSCVVPTVALLDQAIAHVSEHGCAPRDPLVAKRASLAVRSQEQAQAQTKADVEEAKPAKPKQPGVGITIAGAGMMGLGAAFGVLGAIGFAWNASCDPFCGDGTVATGFVIAGGSLVVVGFSLLITGVVTRNRAKAGRTVNAAPIVAPGLVGLGFGARF